MRAGVRVRSSEHLHSDSYACRFGEMVAGCERAAERSTQISCVSFPPPVTHAHTHKHTHPRVSTRKHMLPGREIDTVAERRNVACVRARSQFGVGF